jgi:nitrous oxide reductase accessory protein NosL
MVTARQICDTTDILKTQNAREEDWASLISQSAVTKNSINKQWRHPQEHIWLDNDQALKTKTE